MAGRVQDKVCIVTGAAQGIGFGCAELLAKEGARVVIGDINPETGTQAAKAIRALGGRAIFQQVDLVQEAQCQALIEAAVGNYGRLDVLVNNAGYYPRATIAETTTELWEQLINVNLRSAFYCCKYAIPHMQAAKGGSIINIGSIHGLGSHPNLFAYGIAKGGLLTLTRTLAGAHGADRIRSNYVIPGWVLSEGEIALHAKSGISQAQLEKEGEKLLLGRHQTPLDTAYAVIYLASDESSQVTGMTFNVDAGNASLPMS